MGYIDEVLFGYKVIERLPNIVKDWVKIAKQRELISRGEKFFAPTGASLKRASLSIPLNIAEGTGKFDSRDKNKFYKIVRGSATECGAILDAIVTIQLMDKEKLERGKKLLYRIVYILSKLV